MTKGERRQQCVTHSDHVSEVASIGVKIKALLWINSAVGGMIALLFPITMYLIIEVTTMKSQASILFEKYAEVIELQIDSEERTNGSFKRVHERLRAAEKHMLSEESHVNLQRLDDLD